VETESGVALPSLMFLVPAGYEVVEVDGQGALVAVAGYDLHMIAMSI
jgi:hypothetical protein